MSIKLGNVLIAGSIPAPVGAMSYKDSILQENLPVSGQVKGDYYSLTDVPPSIYAGQCAIWNGAEWKYSSASFTVDSELSTTSTNPVENKVVTNTVNNMYTKTEVDNLLKTLKQTIYDGMHPVNDIQMGFQAPAVPADVTATWTDVSASYNGRYFKVSSTDAAGTAKGESISIANHTLTKDEMPTHSHDKGSYKIIGDVGPFIYPGSTADHNGALAASYNQNWGYNGTGYGSDYYAWHIVINTDTDKTCWTGNSGNAGGGGGHNHTASGINPVATTIKVWKRTA